ALLMGLVTALAVMYVALQWSEGIEKLKDYVPEEIENIDEDIMATQREELPEPPKPEVKIEQLPQEFVATEEEVDTHPDFTSEATDEGVQLQQTIQTPTEEEDPEETPLLIVEKMPEFPGGEAAMRKFIASNLRYPAACAETGIQGRVVCQFVVNKDGKIVDVEVIKKVHPDLDAEAVRVIKKMPAWTPGRQGGKAVRVKYNVPIRFKL
ncbi:MAG: energy transducer TonB, partial [Paludibacteraceae bacterium]|nr:energy transducer TonB [Paludibacteraceae bacterium]